VALSSALTTETDIGRALGTDYFLLRSELTVDEAEYLDRTRRFVDEEVLPVMSGYWERAELPLNLARRLGELGLVGDGIEGYGCPPMSTVAAGLIQMELSRGDGSLGTLLGVQAGLAMRSIAAFGSEEQKQRWLPRMARMEALGAFALTEPEHSSDSVALETTAERQGDEYVIDGAKRWIGNGSLADVVVVWARDTADGQVKGFLVEGGTPGYKARVIEGKGSVRSVWQAHIELRGVRVPLDARLPGANTFKDTGKVLASTRVTCAFAALGHAVGAYDAALTYCWERRQFGKPLVTRRLRAARPGAPGADRRRWRPLRAGRRRGHGPVDHPGRRGRLSVSEAGRRGSRRSSGGDRWNHQPASGRHSGLTRRDGEPSPCATGAGSSCGR
jgi:glutaryl-CoA dehydrogenase